MAITVNIYYYGQNDDAVKFAQEMIKSGVVDRIRNEEGNLRYEYFLPLENNGSILLIDSWANQQALDIHHHSEMMQDILRLREKYNLTMKVERFISDDESITEEDKKYIKK